VHPSPADRRAFEAREDPEGERLAEEAAEAYLHARILMARALSRIEESGTFRLRGCSSVVHFAVRLGVPAYDARMLADLARVLDLEVPRAVEAEGAKDPVDGDAAQSAREDDGGVPAPTVEERIRSGHLPVENAALVGRVIAKAGPLRPEEDWLGSAESLPTATLRRCVDHRIEEAAQGTTALTTLTLHVTERARAAFRRAEVVASRDAGTRLTRGQTFGLIVERYLDAFDELRRDAGSRRVGPTADLPRDRYVPAAVRRAVLERSEDRCEVPSCTFDTFLELAHIEAHAFGGSREADNLLRLCHAHHAQMDAGRFRFAGWRESPGLGTLRGVRRMQPLFQDVRGREYAASEFDLPSHRGPERESEASAATDESEVGTRHGSTHVAERPPPYGMLVGVAGGTVATGPP